jgi:predicted RNA-binding protein with PUA-like domain
VDFVSEKNLSRPVALATIKDDKAFADFPLVRILRLSVVPVSEAECARIEKLSRSQVISSLQLLRL